MSVSGSIGGLAREDFEAVGKVDLFRDLTVDEIKRLLRGASCRWLPRNTLLFVQGDMANSFFVVLDGRVKLIKTTESGTESIVEIFTPGQSFGEAAMFASRRFPLGAEVLADARLIQIPAEPFLAELARSPELSLKLLASLSRHYRRLMQHLSELKLNSPSQRLGSYLLSLTDATDGATVIHLPIDKGAVASHVGITPESLSRALARLRDNGVICRGRKISIHNIQALRQFCLGGDSPPTSDSAGA
ncbi:MAG: cyclic nucleotide-binding domain-containing protein [Alphaproteobacteria bacterium]|nr:cyclic nucleotide-binding domain-containing protein [Alphaproteobacteria bacterium]